MGKIYWLAAAVLMALPLAAPQAQPARVGDPLVLAAGREIFRRNCAVCHGWEAEGTVVDWKRPGADGKYPPPPLNGTAHAWHHPLSQLRRVVRDGTAGLGGSMPAWRDALSEAEIDAVLHYIISLWPQEVFEGWAARGGYD